MERNFKDGLKGEENSWRVPTEAERSHPSPLTWETPLSLQADHITCKLHLVMPSSSSLLFPWVTVRKKAWSLWNTGSPACCTPPQASSTEFHLLLSCKCLSKSTAHTAHEEENVSLARCLIAGTCLRYGAQFPVWKISRSWESKIHTTFCRNLMGNYVWGNFCNLRYANSLFDCNANPWSGATTLPLIRWEAIKTSILKMYPPK